MSDVRISGLISGMDVDSLIESILKVERQPMKKIEEKLTYQNMKKEVLTNQVDSLQQLKDTILNLKLESTFKDKSMTTSDDSVVKGTANMTAVKGNYAVKVNNLAVPARISSTYSRATILNSPPNTMNLYRINGRPKANFDGKVDLEVTSSGSNYTASATYSKTGGGQIGKVQGTTIESATTQGTIANTISTANSDLDVTVNGYNFTINVDFALQDDAELKNVAKDIQGKINDYLNSQEGTTDVSYVMVNAESQNGTGNEHLSFYNLNSNDSDNLQFTGGNARALLGLSSTTFSSETEIADTWIDTSLSGLRTKLNDTTSGILPGVSIVPESSGEMTEGEATLRVNAQLRTLDRIYPRIDGEDDVSDSTSIDINQTISTVGFNNGPLSYASDKSGKFSINGVTVEVPDMSTATVHDVMSIINSSGAGVTASYDENNDRFMLTANESYLGSNISLGDAGDTTNLLEVMGLSLAHGGTLYPGSTAATIDPDSTLNEASFSEVPASGTFTINDVSLYVDVENDTLYDVVEKINSSNAGVIATYDINSDTFVLKTDPDNVDTNAQKISLGSSYDTSNLLQALNLTNTTSRVTGTAQSGNRGVDKVTFSAGSSDSSTITIPATTASGSYNATPLTMNWSDGIANLATIGVTIDTGGAATAHTWTNNSGSTITSADDFVSAWNDSTNWSGGTVEVGAIKEDDGQIRFFNRNTNVDFQLTEGTPGDGTELGFGGASITVSNGAGASATAEYNALNFAYALMQNSIFSSHATVQTDGSGGITIDALKKGTSGLFILTDEASQAATTVDDYFGDFAVKSNLQADVGNLGEDAEIVVDGVFYTRTNNKVDDVIGGVELNLLSTSNSLVTVSVDNDTESAVEAVADFIFEYNRILKDLNPPLVSKDDRKYLEPLTDEKLDSFKTVSEVDEYEKKYEEFTGYKVIREESSLRTFYNYMRSSVSTPMENGDSAFQILSDLGIEAGSVGGYEDSKKGYLIKSFDPENQTEEEYKEDIIEELKRNTTFMDALNNNEEKVYKFFSFSAEDSDQSGLARRIESKINSYILTGGILKDKVRTNGYIDNQTKSMYEQYEAYEKRLEMREQTLYDRFTAMEETMARLQEQMNALSQKMGTASPQQ